MAYLNQSASASIRSKFLHLIKRSMCLICFNLLMLDMVNAEKQENDPCGHDAYEPNNLRAKARNLSQELKDTREVSANLCKNDKDWYTVWLNRGELAEFNVITSLETPPQIKIFAPRKRKPRGISRRITPAHRQVRVYAKQSGRYRILLEKGGEARTRYQLYLRRLQPMGL